MANTNAPFGFIPYGVIQGMAPNFGLTPRKILYTNTTQIFTGDPVTTQTTGYIAQSSAPSGTTQIAGIFWGGCEYYSTSGKIPRQNTYWPGSDANADPFPSFIISNPNSTFLVQVANSNTAAAASNTATLANVGMTANFAFGTGNGTASVGNTASGRSTAYLDLYQAGNTATQPFRILQLGSDFLPAGSPGSDPTTPYNWVLVGFNNQEMRTTAGHS